MKKSFLFSLEKTIPVMIGYIVMGIAFGLLLGQVHYSAVWALFISVFVYAGSMQFVLVGLLTSGASLVSVAIITLTVNSRHLFYGLSFVEKYKNFKNIRPYLIFALTDETYSLLCNLKVPEDISEKLAYFFITLLNHLYWIIGCVSGVLVSQVITINTKGVEFAMTALFTVIFTEQWITMSSKLPAIIGLICGTISFFIFGAENFVLPALISCVIALILLKGKISNVKCQEEIS